MPSHRRYKGQVRLGPDVVPARRRPEAARPAAHRGQGPREGGHTVTISRNEILYAFNQGEKFVLAIVLVNEDDSVEGPYYVRRPFDREPGWGVASINYNLGDLLQKAETR